MSGDRLEEIRKRLQSYDAGNTITPAITKYRADVRWLLSRLEAAEADARQREILLAVRTSALARMVDCYDDPDLWDSIGDALSSARAALESIPDPDALGRA